MPSGKNSQYCLHYFCCTVSFSLRYPAMTDPAKELNEVTAAAAPLTTPSSMEAPVDAANKLASASLPKTRDEALDKENNGSASKELSSASAASPKKRSSPETVEVTNAANDDNTNKRLKNSEAASSSSHSEPTSGTPLDLAVTLGFKPGDRLEVQWEVEMNDETVVKWWGATLEPHDGRTTDSVAIRTLHYDACPELGFDEPNDEDVIFLGEDLLVSPDSTTQLNFRREGEEDVYWLNEQDMDEQLNAILMGAMAKNQATWQKLEPAQQLLIAEKIKTKKEQLVQVLRSKNEVITSTSIQDILRETFGSAASR